MKQQESSLEGAPIYVTANSLMNDDITLTAAIQIAREAGAEGFELRRELCLPLCNPMRYRTYARNYKHSHSLLRIQSLGPSTRKVALSKNLSFRRWTMLVP